MANEAIKFGLRQQVKASPGEKINGVTLATVVNNIDATGEARVQVMLPWLPGFLPWARLAMPMAGMLRGTFFVPQIGDEVLVAFNHGDVREPYIVGTLWNTVDRPPSLSPTDAVTQRKIRSPLGHELAFDEALQSVTLTSNTLSTVKLDPAKAEISTPAARVTIGKLGDVTITAATKLTLNAPVIEITASTALSIRSANVASVEASGPCSVRGAIVKIN